MLLNFEHLKTFYSALKQKMKNFRGNWDQNDPTADDYIKNRPFYSEGNDVEILSKTIVPNEFSVMLMSPLVAGQKYKIIFDGGEYTSIARLYNGIIVVGNLSIIDGTSGGDSDTGEPFLVGAQDLFVEIAIKDTQHHTIQILESKEVIHKIDKKYLPDDITTTDKDVINRLDALEETDEDIIKNLAWGSFNKNGVVKAAGLYQTGTDIMIKTWEDLLVDGTVHVDNGTVYTNHVDGSWSNSSSDALTGDLVLPNDGSIISLGDHAFAYCRNLTRVAIPDVITFISDYAFYDCASLTNMVIPDNVISIGHSAFGSCESLTSIEIPANVMSIDTMAFYYCENLVKIKYNAIECEDLSEKNEAFYNAGIEGNGIHVIIGANVKKIPASLFYSTNSYDHRPKIVNLEFENSSICESIGNYAFAYCDQLPSINIPDSVTFIGQSAFSSCSNLTSVAIPDSVTMIGDYAFYNCDSLTSIIIPSSVTSIGKYALAACENLTSVDIPNSVTTISDHMFWECSSLTSIVIPDSVTSIDKSAFSGCDNLISVTIGASVTSITSGDPYNAFDGCVRLVEVYNKSALTIEPGSGFNENGEVGYYAKNVYTPINGESKISIDENGYVLYTDESLVSLINYTGTETDLTLPSEITEINQYALRDCINLTNIVIPKGVTNIGRYAFNGCSGLMSVVIPNSVVTIGDNTFRDCGNLLILCEAENQPSGWATNWNYSNRPVLWGYTGEDIAYTFETNGGDELENIISKNMITLPAPIKEGYYFDGWYDNAEYTGTPVSSPYYSSTKTTLYAKWLTEEEYCDGTSFNRAKPVECGTYPVVIDQKGEKVYFKFVPSTSKSYKIYSSGGLDTYGHLYDKSQSQIAYHNGNTDFSITKSLTAGTIYYIAARFYSSSKTGEFTITIE